MRKWTTADMPDLTGRVAVVTGANTGLGFETAMALAQRGAELVLACRDQGKAEAATERIRRRAPGAVIGTVELDLASLASVHRAATIIGACHDRIDLLINNAGVTGLSGTTEDGFEAQFGINHLGHFALTGLLWSRITAADSARVVTVSSIGHRFGRIDPEDPAAPIGNAYGKSKLANLLFTYELDRRLADTPAVAVAAHPGGASTDVFRYSPAAFRLPNLAIARLFGRTPAMGALPTLRAATDPTVVGGEYYGPSGLFGIAGYPDQARSSAHSRDPHRQRRLWEVSEQLTGVSYPAQGR
ncbi:oxidoreductase [Nocardia goodfellowii]|uniref:NAD(P)-dependent dehydrogenase (Short-subunit alcohol dehydrogenase family) n=1 Tax=Nocardia goodfellowii TaxID=882446 RepID=A0ABS4QHQ6_9NOCA|nr:oxidoreductase [Nocardia goodfellowii]MBP2191185.1 NAD(P)-dependent dehydrogenase (short-subunit alcohol dehydrogenase family) [Nocardia goodfellowii]